MPEFGLLPTGFRIKTQDEIREAMAERLRAVWGTSFDLTEGSPFGQFLTITAAEIAEAWRAGQALYAQLSRDTATGVGLDARLLQTGTLRAEAEPSTVTLLLVGTTGTTVTSGSRVLTESTEVAFRTIADGELAALTEHSDATMYELGDLVTDGGNVYRRVNNAGGGDVGPDADPTSVCDAGTADANPSALWELLGEGDGAVEVEAVSVDTGAVVAVAYDLSTIETPIGGWSAAWNLLDADLGRDEATDAEARIAGEEDLARPASTTKDAIRQTLLRIADVTAVAVFQNVTDAVDADGVPAHAIECLVTGGDDTTIFETIFEECAAAGIATHGTETGTVEDSEGVDHTIKFSRPIEVPIYVIVTLTKVAHDDSDPDSYPTDGDAQVEEAIVTAMDARAAGYNAVASKVAAAANAVTGVLDVSSVLIGTVNPPVASTTIAISTRQQATWDTTRITVNSSSGTP
jgi:uncharacterized phage protein gp47/JayE